MGRAGAAAADRLTEAEERDLAALIGKLGPQ